MATELKTFADIYTTVCNDIGVPTTDTTSLTRVKRFINIIYMQRVASKANWQWLTKETVIRRKATYDTGTVSVTNASTTVTLSGAPAATVGDSGSFLEYYIKISGFDEIYRISAHTALATAITISSAYLGTTNTTASYQIWRPWEILPLDCAEVIDVYIDRGGYPPLEGLGIQQFHRRRRLNPYASGFPEFFSQDTKYHDPTSGTVETDTDRYRKLWVYPAIDITNDVTLNVVYKMEVTALDATTDEPLIPFEDREILVFGAEWMAWKNIVRDIESSELSKQDFKEKLKDMLSKNEAGSDYPRIGLDTTYTALKRARVRG